MTALMVASEKGHTEIVRLFLSQTGIERYCENL